MDQDSIFLRMIVAQMALDGVSSVTIQFFVKTFPSLRRGAITTKKMAEVAIVTRGHARWQASRLEKSGYFQRCSRETWGIANSPVSDRHLKSIMRKFDIEIYSEVQNRSGKEILSRLPVVERSL